MNATAFLRAFAKTAAGCCTSRRSVSWVKAARVSGVSSSSSASAILPSTRRTASASGATTSGRNTGSSGGSARTFPQVSLHAFTATATGRVRDDIARELALRDPVVLVGSFDRPNLLYRVLRRANLRGQLLQILARHEDEAGIVYCPSRREVESLAAWLREEGYRAVPYHAGLADDVRARHQEAFLDERADIVVATVAFGMGIDRSNVRFVIHAGAPRSPEHYQQESGRAGRDGLQAECVLIYSGADFVRWRQMLEANGELTDSARALLRDMERYAAGTHCRHRSLVEYFGEPYTRSECGACDWCLKELDPVADAHRRRAQDPVVRGSREAGVGYRPRDRRADRPRVRQGGRQPPRHAIDLRPAARGVCRGSARLHRTARRGTGCC